MSKIDEFLASLKTTAEVAAPAATDEVKTAEETKTAEVTKTAEELELEKFAAEVAEAQAETVDAASSLHVCADYLNKVAEAAETEKETELAEILKEASEALVNAGSNLYTGISKVACGDVDGMIVDMVQTQDGLSKVAEAISALAPKFENETFTKVAETIVAVNNDMFDELAELAQDNENVANYIAQYHAE